jgi:hypothetical protein
MKVLTCEVLRSNGKIIMEDSSFFEEGTLGYKLPVTARCKQLEDESEMSGHKALISCA